MLELTDYTTLVQKASIVEAGNEQIQKEREDKKRRFGSKKGSFTGVNFLNKFSRGRASQFGRNPGATR